MPNILFNEYLKNKEFLIKLLLSIIFILYSLRLDNGNIILREAWYLDWMGFFYLGHFPLAHIINHTSLLLFDNIFILKIVYSLFTVAFIWLMISLIEDITGKKSVAIHILIFTNSYLIYHSTKCHPYLLVPLFFILCIKYLNKSFIPYVFSLFFLSLTSAHSIFAISALTAYILIERKQMSRYVSINILFIFIIASYLIYLIFYVFPESVGIKAQIDILYPQIYWWYNVNNIIPSYLGIILNNQFGKLIINFIFILLLIFNLFFTDIKKKKLIVLLIVFFFIDILLTSTDIIIKDHNKGSATVAGMAYYTFFIPLVLIIVSSTLHSLKKIPPLFYLLFALIIAMNVRTAESLPQMNYNKIYSTAKNNKSNVRVYPFFFGLQFMLMAEEKKIIWQNLNLNENYLFVFYNQEFGYYMYNRKAIDENVHRFLDDPNKYQVIYSDDLLKILKFNDINKRLEFPTFFLIR